MPVKRERKKVDKDEKIVAEIMREVEDSGRDVDEIKEDIDEIREEVTDSGKDVDEIKEDVEEIKEDIDEIQKHQASLLKKLSQKLPSIPSLQMSKFNTNDIAQQIVGAMILSVPFAVTEEVWRLATELDPTRLVMIFFITLLFDIILIYYTKFQNVQTSDFKMVAARIFSLTFISYATAWLILYLFGVIGPHVGGFEDTLKLIVFVGLFANIGASTADVLR
jgi:uncharacterized membrane protein